LAHCWNDLLSFQPFTDTYQAVAKVLHFGSDIQEAVGHAHVSAIGRDRVIGWCREA